MWCFLDLLICFYILIAMVSGQLRGLNVCRKIENYTVEVVATELESNGDRPFDLHCCDGYKPNPTADGCIPSDYCQCDEEASNLKSNSSCPHGFWGKMCAEKCDCVSSVKCHPATGACICPNGFTGKKCRNKCSLNFYGAACQEHCRCRNGATCDQISGACICPSRFTGPLCETECTNPQDCIPSCPCQNGGKCDRDNGSCICPPNWTGEVCANKCPHGFYGLNCTKTCCSVKCPLGFYGKQCDHACVCKNNSTCDRITGSCRCLPNWTGYDCTELSGQEHNTSYASSGIVTAFTIFAVCLFIVLLSYSEKEREIQDPPGIRIQYTPRKSNCSENIGNSVSSLIAERICPDNNGH